MTITADGGWLLALLFIALLLLGVVAYRKRWPSRKPVLAFVGGSTGERRQEQTVQTAEKKSHEKHGSSGWADKLKLALLWLIGIAAVIYVIFHLPAIIDTFLRFVGINVVTPQEYSRRWVRVKTVQVPVLVTEPVPTPAPIVECLPFSMEVQTCTLNKPVILMFPSSVPAGLRSCWNAEVLPNVRMILVSGDKVDFDQYQNDLPVNGYEFLPVQSGTVLRYWLTTAPTCS